MPDDAEAGGGLMVAVVQMAITAGAAGGGVIFDAFGYLPTFSLSAILFCLSAAFAFLSARSLRRAGGMLFPMNHEAIDAPV